MKRPAVLVLLLTFVALIVASVWVPAYWTTLYESTAPPLSSGYVDWCWIWQTSESEFTELESRAGYLRLHRSALVLEYGLILAIGGLLALALRVRQRKRLAISHH